MRDSGTAVTSGSNSPSSACLDLHDLSTSAPGNPVPPISKTTMGNLEVSRRWNTSNLVGRIAVDASSAACAAFLVAPLIATIDKAIIENASQKATLKESMINTLKRLIFRPHTFFFSKPFGLIFAVYGGTYLTANSIDTFLSTVRDKPASKTTHGTAKFAATSTANVSLSLWKDSHFTKLFSNATPRAIPPPTYALFMLRDSLTIFASFNVPPLIAPHIPMGLMPGFMQGFRQQSIAQFLAPAAVQFISTPLHLYGLDMYNRNNVSISERFVMVKRAWLGSSFARIARIVPAFGVGGVVNTAVRRDLMERLE